MKVEPVEIEGLLVVTLFVMEDERGFFTERFKASEFASEGLPTFFEQDNHSRSRPGVLRGLHYQHTPALGKLVGVTRGRIWDVAVDLRADSGTYGQSFGLELSDSNGTLLWIPPGFAHGFCVLGEEDADVVYKMTDDYNAAGEGGVLWSDEDLAIDWPIQPSLLSQKDRALQSFADYRANPVF